MNSRSASSRSRRRRPSGRLALNSTTQGLRTINTTLHDLALLTQNKFLPTQRDVAPAIGPPKDQVYRFVRSYTNPTQVTATATGAAGALAFTLNSVATSSDFTSLFDQYRMVNAVVKFVPLAAPLGQSTSSTNFPVIYTAIDPDDSTAPASQADLEQYETLQVVPNGQPFQRSLTPKAAIAAYSGVFTSFAQAPQRMWMDCSSDSIQFYGLKWFVPAITTAGTFNLYAIEIALTMEFRHPR